MEAGASWRYVSGLIAALDHTSVWRAWRRHKAGPDADVPVLEGAAAEAAVRQIK